MFVKSLIWRNRLQMRFRLIHMSVWRRKPLIFASNIYNIQLIAYSPLGFNAATIVLQDTGMQIIAEKIGITKAQLSLAWLLSKRICVIPKTKNIQRQKENFRSKDAIYDVLHFSDKMDKISEGKDPRAFLLETAEKSQEDANRVRFLVWNNEV